MGVGKDANDLFLHLRGLEHGRLNQHDARLLEP